MERNKIYLGNCLEVLKTLPDNSINCCITSPPYYGLRDYGTGKWVGGNFECRHIISHKRVNSVCGVGSHSTMESNNIPVGSTIIKKVCPLCGAIREDNQIGLEESPEEYIKRLVDVFSDVYRILKDDGTLWINIGDSYVGSGSRGCNYDDFNHSQEWMQTASKGTLNNENIPKFNSNGVYKNKDLIGIPWMLAFALRECGWYLRQDIIWSKPNPMPESVKDRCTKSHEYVFLLSKSAKYYFDIDSIKESTTTYDYTVRDRDSTKLNNTPGRSRMGGLVTNQYEMRHKRDVWNIIPAHYKEARFATFPEELVYPMIIAGCPKGGIVLDPFMGSGTVGAVAKRNHRDYIGIDLNPQYIEMAEHRIKTTSKKLF